MTARTWLITGANSGFGREMTEQLLARGERVAGTVRDLASMADLQARHGAALWLAQLDVTDTPAIRAVVAQAFKALGTIDVVVSNAGYGLFGAAEEMTDEQIDHQLDTNLLGSIQLLRAALPHLRAQGGGRILQLSTMGGQAVFPGGSLYHASKWGIEGFVDALGEEVACFNIGCTLIEPGSARTDFRYRSAQLATRLEDYDRSPSSHARRMIEDRTRISSGDPAKMVAIMIASVDQHPAPKRIALGPDAYTVMHKQLSDRLAVLEAQKDLAFSTDFSAP
ncbi:MULTISPECIES: SDR family oxidoreductase [unclassified Pseudomonas]|uniref:SDR family oxidoreductase n=1 Tax=unclassified Pseudomonas TaxID=196821 RepID=UPI0015A04110|nr:MULTISPECIES: SDR family oxidoreductase [unclassified Pseudomonas]NWC92570.1 SDR family oxidoreductase [Pseudomonas sp. IPO3779]NWD15568.1 SDR family oxidoreductase [Pseudomonas sp. IPO3778]